SSPAKGIITVGAIVLVAALGAWLLFIRTPDDPVSSSTNQSASGTRPLTPTYPAVSSATTTSSVVPGSTTQASSENSSTTAVSETTAPATQRPTSATLTDPVGDRTFSADPPP